MGTWNLNSLIILKCTLNDKLKPRYGLSSWEFHKNNRDKEPCLKLLVSWELPFPMMRYKKLNRCSLCKNYCVYGYIKYNVL